MSRPARPSIARSSPELPNLHDSVRQFVRLLHACGFSDRDIRDAFKRAQKSHTRRAPSKTTDPAVVFAAAHVLTQWFQTPTLLGPKGQPKAVPLLGAGPTIESIIRSIVGEPMTKGVIAYLRRIRGIQKTQRGWVPTHRKLRVDRDPFGAAWHGLQSVAGILRTIDHNVRAGKKADRNFEGRVQSRSLDAAAIPQIHRTARRLGDEYLARLDRLMRSAETTSKRRSQRTRLGVGAYFYQIRD